MCITILTTQHAFPGQCWGGFQVSLRIPDGQGEFAWTLKSLRLDWSSNRISFELFGFPLMAPPINLFWRGADRVLGVGE